MDPKLPSVEKPEEAPAPVRQTTLTLKKLLFVGLIGAGILFLMVIFGMSSMQNIPAEKQRQNPKTTVQSSGSGNITSPKITISEPKQTVSHMKLPLGDNKYSTAPKQGYIYLCRTQVDGGGAFQAGPWIDQMGKTWDLTKKVSVDGSVAWSSAKWSVTVNGTQRLLSGNGLPSHTTGVYPIAATDDAYTYDRNPNSIKTQTYSLTFPATPTRLSTPECVGGEVGIMLSGVPLFNGFDAGGRDAVAWEVQDHCSGHPQSSGLYHYHGPSSCVTDKTAAETHSALEGYALDGFGIYGVKGEGGYELTSADLDECHGHTHKIAWDGKNVSLYHYHLTYDFPYSVGCYRAKKQVQGPLGGGAGMGSKQQPGPSGVKRLPPSGGQTPPGMQPR